MKKRLASILVICRFPEDEKMYPHLKDVLTNLRDYYDEVIYVGDDPRYYPQLEIDKIQQLLGTIENLNDQIKIQNFLNDQIDKYYVSRAGFIDILKRTGFKHPHFLVLAIDDNAFNCAMEVFPNNTVYWSFDILGKDCPCRLAVDGLVEKMIHENSLKAGHAKALIVQDREREAFLLHSFLLPTSFAKTFYLPVSLNDSYYCKIASLKRRHGGKAPGILRVVQSGHIDVSRFSEDFIRSFEEWPDNFELHLRGYIAERIKQIINRDRKTIYTSDTFFPNDLLHAVLDGFDIGLIGYSDCDGNHNLIVNACSQLVTYLQLGMPVICCGSEQLISFVGVHGIGIGIKHPSEINAGHFDYITANYSRFSQNARELYERHYDLRKIMDSYFFLNLDNVMEISNGRV